MEIKAGELKGTYDVQSQKIYAGDAWRPCENTCIACQTAIIII